MEPLFSLLTTCFNGEQFITNWKESIFAQKYRPLQVIFIDDKSTDNSVQKVTDLKPEFFQQDISLLVFQHKKKLQYGKALQYALSFASGKYFGVLDIDDMLTPGSVEHVMDLYNKYPEVGYIYTQFVAINQEGKRRRGFNRIPRKGYSILTEGLENQHTYSHFRTFSRRVKDFQNIIPGYKYAVDQYMGLKLEELSIGLFTNRICYKYSDGHPGTISSKFGSQRRTFWHKMLEQFRVRREEEGIMPHPIIQANKIPFRKSHSLETA